MAITTDKWKFEIANDNMSAKLLVTPPENGEHITTEDVTAYLHSKGIVYGILYSEIEKITSGAVFYKDVVVAKGRDIIEGENGHYEFMFSTGQIKHPTIRSDGSVDYQSMSVIQSVRPGDVLAVYHPAVSGSHGMDIRGRELRCKPAKDQPEIRGSGFEVSFDGKTYTATVEGRVEYDNFKLFIRDMYELRGDLNLVNGRIDFRGDVVIYGNVRTGTYIRATKSVTIEGAVEGATIIAEGDIVLKKGMQGGGKAKIICGGNLYANFIEFTEVKAKGNVEANIILNSRVSAGKNIIIKGRRGTVIGEIASAIGVLETTMVGNDSEVKTVCCAGISAEHNNRYHLLLEKAESAKKSIAKTKFEIEQIRDVRLSSDPKEVKDAKISRLTRHLKRDERLLEHVMQELDEEKEVVNLGMEAKVLVHEKVNVGTVVRIDNLEYIPKAPFNNVEFYRPTGSSAIEVRQL